MYETIDRHEVKRLMDSGACLLEVLPRKLYDREHIAGAVSCPLGELAEGDWDRRRGLITYCNSGT